MSLILIFFRGLCRQNAKKKSDPLGFFPFFLISIPYLFMIRAEKPFLYRMRMEKMPIIILMADARLKNKKNYGIDYVNDFTFKHNDAPSFPIGIVISIVNNLEL